VEVAGGTGGDDRGADKGTRGVWLPVGGMKIDQTAQFGSERPSMARVWFLK
jgi:hypothetical protein